MTGIWYIVGFAFAGVSFVFLTIGAAWLISHRNRGDVHKGLPYESGIDTYGDTHGRFGLSFYIYALLFVAFDIEVVFIYLWAIVFRDLLLGGLVSMLIFVGDPPARARLRLAEGGPDVAVKPGRRDAARARLGPARGRRPARRDVVAPIIVPNTLWQAADPVAYDGGQRERHHPPARVRGERPRPARRRPLERRPRGHPDQGRLRPRPDPDEQPVAAPVRARLLRDRDDVGGDQSKNDMDRWGMFPFRASPRQADVLIVAGHADDQDGRPARPPLGADARAEVVRGDGRLHLLRRPLQAELRDGRGDRPGHAGRRLRARAARPARRASSTG